MPATLIVNDQSRIDLAAKASKLAKTNEQNKLVAGLWWLVCDVCHNFLSLPQFSLLSEPKFQVSHTGR